MMTNADDACQAIRRLRKRYRLGQAELATLLGSSESAVQAWEHGRRTPCLPVRTLIRLVEAALEEWPPGGWRRRVWGRAVARIIAMRKGEAEAEETEPIVWDDLSEFEERTPEEQAAAIQELEKRLQQLKEIAASAKTNLLNQVSIAAEVQDRWEKTCREFARTNPLVRVDPNVRVDGRVEEDGSLTMFARLCDGLELSMRVEPKEWERSP